MSMQNWATPLWLYSRLEAEFGEFDVDVCAEGWSAKHTTYYTEDKDGLAQDWGGVRFFCNPPFSRAPRWLKKGAVHVRAGGCSGVYILPASTDTRWFHDLACLGTVILLRGRVQFEPPPTDCKGEKSGNTRGTLIVVFNEDSLKNPAITKADWHE